MYKILLIGLAITSFMLTLTDLEWLRSFPVKLKCISISPELKLHNSYTHPVKINYPVPFLFKVFLMESISYCLNTDSNDETVKRVVRTSSLVTAIPLASVCKHPCSFR